MRDPGPIGTEPETYEPPLERRDGTGHELKGEVTYEAFIITIGFISVFVIGYILGAITH